MMHRRRFRRAAMRGFTLIEALVATALMGLVLAALATITAQWLPNWNRGIARVQRAELVSMSLDRLTADLQAAEFIPANRDAYQPLFEGTASSVILVRSAIGPDARPGLEIVRLAEVRDDRGTALVRSTMPFAPFDPSSSVASQLKFANPVVLLRAPYRISFSYAARDGQWRDSWQDQSQLPADVRLTVRDGATQQPLSISTTALVHVELPACMVGQKKENCMQPGQNNRPKDDQQPPPPPSMRGALPLSRSVL
jgi:general secretion pathway protein J